MSRAATPSPDEFAMIAKSRAEQALQRYGALGDHWSIDPPTLTAAADVAVDAAIGLEASLKCIADQHGCRAPDDGPRAVFRALWKSGRLPPAITNAGDAYLESLRVLFDARNAYLHGGLPSVDPLELLGAVKDALQVHLALAQANSLLRSQWPDIDDALWRFGGQPRHFAAQVRRLLSGKRFDGLRLYGEVARFTGGSALRISGALEAVVDVEQTRWVWSGSAGSILDLIPTAKAEVGMITPPNSDEMKLAPGERVSEGTLQIRVRDLPVRADGFVEESNPLAVPVYLLPDERRAWMVGPGDLSLAWLLAEVPYRVRMKWFVTPDGRLEAVGELLQSESQGKLTGELRFHHPGHRGYPAFRGAAQIEGTTSGVFPGVQVAEWRHVRWDPETGVVRSWSWEGVSRLSARWKMTAHIAFDEVEVFD
jgi:hypothetical protein